jgi:hypothetical protein
MAEDTFRDGILEMIKMIEKSGASYGSAKLPFEGYILTIELEKEEVNTIRKG